MSYSVSFPVLFSKKNLKKLEEKIIVPKMQLENAKFFNCYVCMETMSWFETQPTRLWNLFIQQKCSTIPLQNPFRSERRMIHLHIIGYFKKVYILKKHLHQKTTLWAEKRRGCTVTAHAIRMGCFFTLWALPSVGYSVQHIMKHRRIKMQASLTTHNLLPVALFLCQKRSAQ